VLNLIYFLAKSTEETKFKEYFPAIVIWSITMTLYPELSRIVFSDPNSIVQMALIAYHMNDVGILSLRMNELRKVLPTRQTVNISKLPGSQLSINHEHLLPSTVEGLEYVVVNPSSFNFLKIVAEYYSLIVQNEAPRNLTSALEKGYDGIGRTIKEVIYKGGLVS